MTYLLRVAVPDRPGSLGALATALGEVGADIVSLDVVERHDGLAVDDVLVELPHGASPTRCSRPFTWSRVPVSRACAPGPGGWTSTATSTSWRPSPPTPGRR